MLNVYLVSCSCNCFRMSKKAAAVKAKPSAPVAPPTVCKESMVPPSAKTKVVSAAAGSADMPLIVKQILFTPKARSVQYYKDHCPQCNDKEVDNVESVQNDKYCKKCKLQWHPCIKSKQVIATDGKQTEVDCPFCPADDDNDDYDKYC